jgi:hypothetical protein
MRWDSPAVCRCMKCWVTSAATCRFLVVTCTRWQARAIFVDSSALVNRL